MKLCKQYARVLPPSHQSALEEACVVIVDLMLDDLETVGRPNSNIANSFIVGFLPPKYLHRYTPVWLHRFFVCVVTLAWKLAQPEPIPLSCVAEELAARAIIEEAEVVLDMKGEEADFGAFEDALFEDTDFEEHFILAHDGIEDSELAEQLGFANLKFEDWFKPFGARPGQYPAVHPYAEDDGAEDHSLDTPEGEDEEGES